MDDLTNKINTALADSDPDSLEKIVFELSGQGFTRQNIYGAFLEYHVKYQDSDTWIEMENKYNGDHPVDGILDRLSGWCNPMWTLLADEPFENK